MTTQFQISVLLLVLPILVAGSPAFLTHDIEGRQLLPCQVSCGDGWCCYDGQTCMKSSVGDPYICLDQLLTNADGSSMTWPAFDEGSLNSAVSSINSDLKTFSLSITPVTSAPTNPAPVQPPPAATPTQPPAAPFTVTPAPAPQSTQPAAAPFSNSPSTVFVVSPSQKTSSNAPSTASVASPSQKASSNTATVPSSIVSTLVSSQKSVVRGSTSVTASSRDGTSSVAESTAHVAPSSSNSPPALITGASGAGRLLGMFGSGCVATMLMMILEALF